jgi:hypothetical protein
MMRKAMLAILALSAAGAALTIGTGPAAAYDYPYCLSGRGYGYPGECAYRTYEQCQASASGRDAYCNINPAAAYQQPEQQPRRKRRHRNDY